MAKAAIHRSKHLTTHATPSTNGSNAQIATFAKSRAPTCLYVILGPERTLAKTRVAATQRAAVAGPKTDFST